jgi:thymidylate synthase
MISVGNQQSFAEVQHRLRNLMLNQAREVKTERWQGVAANTDTLELRCVNFEVDLQGNEDLDHWRVDAKPNLPWADDHFLERIGGQPLNPGVQWANWPWANRANSFRTQGRFNHSYMERLWPKYARRTEDGSLPIGKVGDTRRYPASDARPKFGITHHYGDLQDLIELLSKEPNTRQAWMPLFHPEDTGLGDGGRKMCSLGYQIIVRDDRAHIWYPLRSCDLLRHWADDCYLAIRMLLWITTECRSRNPARWSCIVPGTYSMHMTSLHVFASDLPEMEKQHELLQRRRGV